MRRARTLRPQLHNRPSPFSQHQLQLLPLSCCNLHLEAGQRLAYTSPSRCKPAAQLTEPLNTALRSMARRWWTSRPATCPRPGLRRRATSRVRMAVLHDCFATAAFVLAPLIACLLPARRRLHLLQGLNDVFQ